MAVQKTDDHFVLTVPRLAGYKTLIVNAILTIYGIAALVWPHLAPLDAQAVSIFVDQSGATLAILIGVLNTALRLASDGPAAPFKQPDDGSTPHGSTPVAVVTAAGKIERTTSASGMLAGQQALASYFSQPGNALAMMAERTIIKPSEHAAYEAAATARLELGEKVQDSGFSRGIVSAFLLSFMLPLLALGVVTASVVACTTVSEVSAIAQAETTEQRAFSLYGTFVVMEERAAILVRDTRLPKNVRQRIQQADRVAKPAADTLVTLARQLQAARREFETLDKTGPTSADKVAALSTRLANALVTLGPKITALVNAVNSASKD